MASYPVLPFDDETNWNEVEVLLFELFSDLNAQGGCCKSKNVDKAFSQAMPFLQLIPFDRVNNTQRWQNDIKSAYQILQPFAAGPMITTSNGLPFILS